MLESVLLDFVVLFFALGMPAIVAMGTLDSKAWHWWFAAGWYLLFALLLEAVRTANGVLTC